MKLSLREKTLPRETIGKLLRIASENKKIISLGPGEPDFEAPEVVVKWTKKFSNEVNHYSPVSGRIELKEAIVKKLKKENKIKAGTENIIVTNGSQEALMLASMSTMDISDQVIIPDPSYLGYKPMFELINAFPMGAELRQDENFEMNPDRIRKLIDKKKTKAILLNYPSNPTGSIIRKKTLEEIADIAREYDLYIFSDEAYEQIIYDGKHISPGSLNGMEKHVCTFHTFSKTFAMCGYRLGYMAGPENLVKAMTKAHIYTSVTASTISQKVGAKVINMPKKTINLMVKEYKRRRDYIVKRLNELNLITRNPQGAFYAFSNISNYSKNSYKFANDLLNNAKVAVLPGSEFGKYGEGFLRFSYATKYEKIVLGMNMIEKYLRSKYKI